jgi:dTDP-4-dehydrorhamnose reductase
MKVLIIGHLGQLGANRRKEFAAEDLGLKDQEDLLVQNPTQVDAVVEQHRPDLILDCAAFQRVDLCED